MQWHSAEHVSLFSTFYIYTCVCNAHTLLMTAKNKTAMFQNLRTVSDIVSSVIQQQQRGTGLSTADSLLNTRGEVHKDSIFRCLGELPKRGGKGGGVLLILVLLLLWFLKHFLFSYFCNSEKNFQASFLWKCSSSTLCVLINAWQTVSMEGHVKISKFILYHKAEMLIRVRIRLSLVNPRQNTWHLCFHWKKNL